MIFREENYIYLNSTRVPCVFFKSVNETKAFPPESFVRGWLNPTFFFFPPIPLTEPLKMCNPVEINPLCYSNLPL